MTVTSAGRMALYLQDKHPIRDGMRYAQYAESKGFEAVWQAESRLVREATVPMAAYAAVTSRIKVGSGVIPIWTRNVGLLAATFSTLWELAPGRIMMGLGAWWEPLASKVGVNRHRPLQAMREVVEATRQLLALQRVSYQGEFVQLQDVEIDIVHGDRSPRDGADLHRRDRHEDDGAGRRDRRRRAAQLHGQPRLQPAGTGGPGGGRGTVRADRRRRSTGRSWSSARSTTTAPPRLTAPGNCSPSISASSRTS